MKWTDTQRALFLESAIPLLASSPYTTETVITRTLEQWKNLQPLFAQTFVIKDKTPQHTATSLDPLLDASIRALSHALLSIQQYAIAKQDENTLQQTEQIYNHLFPKGLELLRYRYDAEVIATKALLKRCEDPQAAAFLKQHSLSHLLPTVEERNKEMETALQGSTLSTPPSPTGIEVAEARKAFEQSVRRIRRYIADRFDLNDPTEKNFRDRFFDMLQRVLAAPSTSSTNAATKGEKETPSTTQSANPLTPSDPNDPNTNRC